MPTKVHAEMDDTPPIAQASESDQNIAQAVQDHLSLISTFDSQLDDTIDAGRDFGGLASRVRQRLQTYREWVTTAEQNCHAASAIKEIAPWTVEARRVSPLKIVLAGPAAGDSAEVEATDEGEADYIMGVGFETG